MTTRVIQYVTITCDGPRCAANHGTDRPVTVNFSDEAMKADPDAMPDDFFRFIKAQPNTVEEKLVEFCSRKCNIDWLNDVYVPPLSPREKAAQLANNQAVEQKRQSRFEGSISQADGIAEAA